MIVRRPKAKLNWRFRKVILDVARFIEKDFLAITGLNLDRKRSFGQTLFSVLSPEETQGNCRAEEPKTVGVYFLRHGRQRHRKAAYVSDTSLDDDDAERWRG